MPVISNYRYYGLGDANASNVNCIFRSHLAISDTILCMLTLGNDLLNDRFDKHCYSEIQSPCNI